MRTQNQKVIIFIQMAIISIVIIAFIRSCIAPKITAMRVQDITVENRQIKEKVEAADIKQLFSKDALKNLQLINNYVLNTKHAYCSFSYKEQYSIVVHKINFLENFDFRNTVDIKNGTAHVSPDISYGGYEQSDLLAFYYSSEYDSVINKIVVIYDDIFVNKAILNDSIMVCDFITKNIAFAYDDNDVRDMIFSSKIANIKESGPIRLSFKVVLYKKKNFIYIIVMYPHNREEILNNTLLLDLLKK